MLKGLRNLNVTRFCGAIGINFARRSTMELKLFAFLKLCELEVPVSVSNFPCLKIGEWEVYVGRNLNQQVKPNRCCVNWLIVVMVSWC